MSDDLIVWLRAALDKDERVADEAPWHLDQREWPFWVDVDDERNMDSTCAYRDHFTPARALAEVAAKRRIIDLHAGKHECVSADRDTAVYVHPDYRYAVDPTLRLLALPYADRPGYSESWRP